MKQQQKTLRTVKLQAKLKETAGYKRGQMASFAPMLTISGNWMEDAGFEPYERVYIQVKKGELVITNKLREKA